MLTGILAYIRQIGVFGIFLLIIYLLNPFSLGFIAGYFLILMIILKSAFLKNNLDFDFFLLLIFSLVYGLFYSFDPVAGNQYIFVYMFTAPFLYIWGKYLIVPDLNNKNFTILILTIGIVLSVPSLISVLINIMEGGFAQRSRSIPMFWNNVPINATGMAAPFLVNMCIPAIIMAGYNRINLPLRIFLAVIFVLTFLCAIRLGSRTQLAITLITLLIVLIYQFRSRTSKQNLAVLLILAIGAFLVYRNVSFDWDSDWLTSFAGRMNNQGTNDLASGGGRTDRWVKSIENLADKPMGWDVEEFGFSHNLWLDVARVGGILSLALLTILTLRICRQLNHFLKRFKKDLMLSATVLTTFIAFFLLCFVDVVIDGSFHIFVTLCILYGSINKYRQITINNPNSASQSKLN